MLIYSLELVLILLIVTALFLALPIIPRRCS